MTVSFQYLRSYYLIVAVFQWIYLSYSGLLHMVKMFLVLSRLCGCICNATVNYGKKFLESTILFFPHYCPVCSVIIVHTDECWLNTLFLLRMCVYTERMVIVYRWPGGEYGSRLQTSILAPEVGEQRWVSRGALNRIVKSHYASGSYQTVSSNSDILRFCLVIKEKESYIEKSINILRLINF